MKNEQSCRICLQQEKEMISILEIPDGTNCSLADIINQIINSDIEFNQLSYLPHQMCIDCKQSAIDAFKFKLKCEEAYMQLFEKLRINKCLKQIERNVETQTENTLLSCGCEFKSYFASNDMKTFQAEADKKRVLSCSFCKISFDDANDLRFHIASAHRETDLNFSPQCCRQSGRTEQLRQHKAIDHKVNNEVNRNNCKHQLTEQTGEICKLLDIEEVDLQMLTENNFNPDSSIEKDEDLFIYIKQFDDQTDEEDNKPLSILQKATKKTDIQIIQLDDETKYSNAEGITYPFNGQTVSSKKNTEVLAETKFLHKKRNNIDLCEVCNKTFKSTALLQRHAITKHQEKSHKCSICEKKFKTTTYLQRHLIMHTKKRYTCKECSQHFLTKDELRNHVKAEGHDKRLLCPECGLRCRTSNILMVHLRRHKGEKPFKCKFCSKGFPRSDDLRLHEKYHTGEKSHFCGTCGKGFQRKYNLNIHLRIHTGEKPYLCPHCPQAFAQRNDLKAHIRRHTGERFRCEHCDATFLQGYQIRQHKLNEHGIRDEPPTQRVAKFTSIEAQEQQILQIMNKESK